MKIGTIGGTFLVILFKINNEDLLGTAILAAIGATVSFGVSLFLKWCWKKLK